MRESISTVFIDYDLQSRQLHLWRLLVGVRFMRRSCTRDFWCLLLCGLCAVLRSTDSDLKAYEVYNEGIRCFMLRDTVCAIQKYKSALALKHDFPEAHQNVAILLEPNDPEAAIAHHKSSVGYFVSKELKASALTNLALLLFKTINAKSAQTVGDVITMLLEANLMSPLNANVLFSIGLIYTEISDHKLGHHYFLKALIADPNHSMASMNVGNYYFRMNEFKQAIVHYKKAIEMSDNGNILEKVRNA